MSVCATTRRRPWVLGHHREPRGVELRRHGAHRLDHRVLLRPLRLVPTGEGGEEPRGDGAGARRRGGADAGDGRRDGPGGRDDVPGGSRDGGVLARGLKVRPLLTFVFF